MAAFRSLRELDAFARSLPISADRRDVVAEELLDHVMARVGAGTSEADALASLGDPALLGRLLAPAEQRFSPRIGTAARAALRVATAVVAVQFAAAVLYGRVPVATAVVAHVGFSLAAILATMPGWVRRASYDARVAFAIVGWGVCALPVLFVNSCFRVPPPDAVGPMLVTLWLMPSVVMFAAIPMRRPSASR